MAITDFISSTTRNYATAQMSTLTSSRLDDALRLNRHRHNPQRHSHEPIDYRNDQCQAGFLDTHHRTEPEQDDPLVLRHDLHQ